MWSYLCGCLQAIAARNASNSANAEVAGSSFAVGMEEMKDFQMNVENKFLDLQHEFRSNAAQAGVI